MCSCLVVLVNMTRFGSTYELAAAMKAKRLSFSTTLGVGVVSFFPSGELRACIVISRFIIEVEIQKL